jgi:DNA-binding NarL/FixJ family response regulator
VSSLRVLVIAREPVGRLGLETLLERSEMTVSASVATTTDALESLAAKMPDVILLARFDRQPVLEDVGKLHAAAPPVPIVVLNARAAAKEVAAAVDAGASSWISARAPIAEIAAAVKTVGSGLVVLSRSSARAFLDTGHPVDAGHVLPSGPAAHGEAIALPASTRPRSLSDRERELLRLLGSGISRTEIAATMGLSVETVKRSVRALLAKLADESAAPTDIRDHIA